MPTEPLAALVYVFLLVPGISYAYQSEKHRPRGLRSAFRETATVVVASSIFLVTVLALTLLTSVFVPELSDWVREFIARPDQLLATNPRGTTAILLAGLGVATAMGLYFGSKAGHNFLHWITGGDGKIKYHTSAWDTVFTLHPTAAVMVTVQLRSGNWVYGRLHEYSPSPIEDGDRAMILVSPIYFRGTNASEISELQNAQAMVIQASEIDYLTTQYISPEIELTAESIEQAATNGAEALQAEPPSEASIVAEP